MGAKTTGRSCGAEKAETNEPTKLYYIPTPKTQTKKRPLSQTSPSLLGHHFADFDPLNDDKEVDIHNEVARELGSDRVKPTVGGAKIERLIAHDWVEGRLQVKALWTTGETMWHELRD